MLQPQHTNMSMQEPIYTNDPNHGQYYNVQQMHPDGNVVVQYNTGPTPVAVPMDPQLVQSHQQQQQQHFQVHSQMNVNGIQVPVQGGEAMMNGNGSGMDSGQQYQQQQHQLMATGVVELQQPVMPQCIRSGCVNPAVSNADWEDEYCSNECVILHCRNVFGNWVQQNSGLAAAAQANAYSAAVVN